MQSVAIFSLPYRMTPFSWLLDGIQAHNLGIAIFCALIFWSIYAYAQKLGLRKEASFFAAMGGVFSPVFLNELDKLSLDRAFLFPIPLLLLSLKNNNRSAILGVAISIGLLFYGQFYYGIFIGAALPFLFIHRLKKSHIWGAIFGLILILPGLLLLQGATGGTVYETEYFWFSDLLNPVSQQELSAYTQAFDPRLGEGLGNRPMNSAKEQLMASIVNSVQPKDILFPSVYFCGQSLYWFWVALAFVITTKKRTVLHSSLDVAILSIFALGPFLRSTDQELLSPLPFYAYQLTIPSFSQLKHPDRFAPMAAIIAAIPIAFALHAILRPIQTKLFRWLITFGALILTLQVGIIKEDTQSLGDFSLSWGGETHRVGLKKIHLPQATQIGNPIQYTFPPQSAVALFPQTHPFRKEQYIPFLAQHIPMQNPAPHGEFSQTEQRLWAEQNRILNGLSYLSASSKINTYLGLNVGELDRKELTEQGLTHIVIHIPDLVDPLQRTFIKKFLQPSSTLIHSDEEYDIYILRTP
jgi:hypothetical protein